jgi:hypothetical protein
MSTGKITKAQVVDALQAAPEVSGWSDHRVDLVADILVRAGLAEEPRTIGLYPYRPACYGDQSQFDAAYWDGNSWWALSLSSKLIRPPSATGDRLLPPKE